MKFNAEYKIEILFSYLFILCLYVLVYASIYFVTASINVEITLSSFFSSSPKVEELSLIEFLTTPIDVLT